MEKRETDRRENAGRKVWTVRLLCACSLLLMLFLSGCSAGPVWTRDDPREVFSGFLQATESQNVEDMWEYLSRETRNELEARAAVFNESADNGTKRRGCDMLRAGHVLATTREYKKLESTMQNDETAVIEIVLHDGGRIPVTLHREENRWTIDLPIR